MDTDLRGRDDVLDRVVASVRGGDHVLVRGPRGVGRSALLDALEVLLVDEGRLVTRVTGTAATRHARLAAVAAVLPAMPSADTDAIVAATARLLGAAPARRCVLVDDVHLLDPASLAVVVATITGGGAPLVLTAPDDVPSAVAALALDRRLRVVELPPLDSDHVRDVLEAAGQPTEDADAVTGLTGGIPRLVHAAVADRREGHGDVGPAFVGAVDHHLADLPTDHVATLRLLAIGSTLPLATAQALAGDALELLEQRSLVQLVEHDDGPRVRPTIPGLVPAMVSGPDTLRRRRLRTLVGTALLRTDEVGPGDRARAARWVLDDGGTVPPEELTAAATDALVVGELPLAIRLGRTAIDAAQDAVTPAAAHVLGEALARAGRADEAEEILADSLAGVPAEPWRTRLALVRARNLAFGFDRPDRSLAVLDDIGGGDPAAEVLADRVLYSFMVGDHERVIEDAASVLADDVGGPARLTTLCTVALVHGLRADPAETSRALAEAEPLVARHGHAVPLAREQLGTSRILSLLAAGRIDEAVDVATRARVEGADGAAATDPVLLNVNESHVRHLWGDLVGAAAALERAAAVSLDPHGLQGTLPAHRVRIAADRGALTPALAAAVPPPGPRTHPRQLVWDAWATAVVALADGRAQDGTAVLRHWAAALAEARHHLWAAELLTVAVRWDAAGDPVARELEAVADACPGADGVAALARFGRAMADRDAARLHASARELAGAGHRLAATEAAMAAARAAQAATPVGLRASTFAAVQRVGLRGARTPLLALDVPTLTDRELEVAMRAPGTPSRAIAEALHITTRTVENHLHAIYRKLDVDGREGLATVIEGTDG